MNRFTKALMTTTMAIAAGALVATSAMATDGMFGNGTGARNKALAGAGVADQNDSTAMSINPAGMVHSDNQLSLSASLFSPRREHNFSGMGAGATIESESEYFVIPNVAWTHRIDGTSVFGLSMYGNGGMNSDYPVNVFGGVNNIGIDLTQIFLSAGIAKSYGNIAVGLAPIVGVQIFKANGIPGGVPEDRNVAFGIGLRGGVEVALAPNFRVAVAGQTPTYMMAFNSYKTNLFGISNGVLDVPGTVTAGVAFDLMPNFTVMADYKRIFYGSVQAIGSSAVIGGFGWNDINIYKFGMEWDVNPGFTLRAGYSYNDQPLTAAASHVFQNVLAPATVQHHFTGGAKFKMTDTMDLELAGMYAPEEQVNMDFGLGGIAHVAMHQYEATVGIIWHLGTPEAPLK